MSTINENIQDELVDMKERIKEFVLGLGVDDVGIGAVSNYTSPRSTPMELIFPEAKSMIVLAYKEPSNCDSPNRQIAINGRLDIIEFSQSCNYRLARFIERKYDARAMTVPYSFPLDMSKGGFADISLRHAAVAAGLGCFGRNNLVIHPKHGVRLIFSAVLCDADLPADPPVKEDLCNHCNICVESCPVGALDEEGKTDIGKCSPYIQPHGLRGTISFWQKFVNSPPKKQKELFMDNSFWELWQAGIVRNMYVCFNCRNSCPIGQSRR